MRLLDLIFILIPRKLTRIISSNIACLYYRFLYNRPSVQVAGPEFKQSFFFSEKRDNLLDDYRKYFPERVEDIMREAELICDHVFDILGSGPKKISLPGKNYQNIDWHIDFISGYRWNPETFYKKIKFARQPGVDIKIPWELSRFQKLVTLRKAYYLSSDLRYLNEIVYQVEDWITHNLYQFGINWRSTMNVAIRAVNWLVSVEFIFKVTKLQEFKKSYFCSLYEHARFIRGNLEFSSKWTTNHYLSNIAGLFFISVCCPFFDKSHDWRNFALVELHEEIEKQVYDDGCTFESSTSYHRLALELFFYSALLGERAGYPFSDDYKTKLRKMFEFSLYCIKPDGMVPQIGDNDSGRLLKFSKRKVLDHSYLLSFAAIYFEDSNFKLKNINYDEEAFWVFGAGGKNIWDELPYRHEPLESSAFPDAGWFIIRHGNDYCFVSCGANGGDGWHSHNDKLSFELMIDGQDIIVDPGTYVYTSYPRERNKFRSTGYHNTIKFDGYEQNELPEENMFYLPDRVKINKAELMEDKNSIKFEGEIQYADINHSRILTYDKKNRSWQIDDSFECPENTDARLHFHLAPGVTTDGKNIFSKNTGEKIASIDVEGHELKKEEYDYSPEYGVKVKAERLFAYIPGCRGEANIKTSIKTLLFK